MTKDKHSAVDSEHLLLTLDQLGQTIDIMNSVVTRLRGQLHNRLQDLDTASADTRQSSDAEHTDAVTGDSEPDKPGRTLH